MNLYITAFIVMFYVVIQGAVDTSKIPLRIPKLETAPKLDGSLDDEVWSHAITIDDFLQRAPREGALPTERTAVYIYYTSSCIYIGLKAFDSQPSKISASTMKRDDLSITENDQFVVVIDSYNSNRNGYWFSTNPLGARVDAQFFDEGEIWEDNWNGIWNCKSAITPEGWSSEIEIPFSTLRYENKDEVIMGMNFFRRIIRTNEQIFSPLIPLSVPYGTPRVSLAKKFLFTGIDYGRNLTLQPYALEKFTAGKGNKFDNNSGYGFDLRYNITDNIVSNLSYNIDFAQAEVDDQQINLSRFGYFYPEKRDFFLENSGIFAVGVLGENQVYFSRKIGLREVSPDNHSAIPILYGMKMTGKLNDFNIGLMNLQVKGEKELPAQNYSVARVKYELPNFYLSGMMTNISDKSKIANTFAADLCSKVFGDAAFYGFAALASTSVKRTNIADDASYLLSLYQSGERTAFLLEYMHTGRNYEPEMGYVKWKGVDRYRIDITMPWYIEKEFLRKISPRILSLNYFNLNGKHEFYQQLLQLDFESQSEDILSISAAKYFENIPYDYNIFKTDILSKGEYEYNRFNLSINSKRGRSVSGSFVLNFGEFYSGNMLEVNPSFSWKINRNITLLQFYLTDIVSLEGNHFTTRLYRSGINYSFNTAWTLGCSFQYNNSTESVGANLRMSYIPSDGVAFYLILNSNTEKLTMLGSSSLTEETSKIVLLKFNYLFRI